MMPSMGVGRLLRGAAALAASLIVCAIAGTAAAKEPRLALVIANGAYQNFDALSATYTDGDRIAGALSKVGFVDASGAGAVRPRRDLDRATLETEIATFKAKLEAAGPETFGVLYFSGHGAALGSYGDVLMLPVDAGKAVRTEDLGLSRATVTKTLLSSGGKTLLIVFDMCRNVLTEPPAPAAMAVADAGSTNTIGGDGTKGLKRLTRGSEPSLRPDQGFMVAFSTSPDQVAFDDGVFSKILAEEIGRTRQNMADALKRVSDRVAIRPGRKAPQKPTFDYALQGDPPCFVSCDPGAGSDRFYDCANCPWMRVVPAGNATLGSPARERGRDKDEPMPRQVAIARPFALGVYEVTVPEWRACVRDGGCRDIVDWSKENPNPLIPATSISYEDAQRFVAWLSVQAGRAYRLPTETEWEYASRGGAQTTFPFGNAVSPSLANYDHTAGYAGSDTGPYRGYPEAVNGYPPNDFGFYQTAGNVWEWTDGCSDASCRQRTVRGGSFMSEPSELRAANRFNLPSNKRRDDVGLRVARDLQPDEAGV